MTERDARLLGRPSSEPQRWSLCEALYRAAPLRVQRALEELSTVANPSVDVKAECC